jgi:hypothetical protein
MLIKNKAGLASSTANGILHHRNLVGLRTICQARLAQQIPSLIERLNNTGTVGSVTWIRLRQAQLDSKSTECILAWNSDRCKSSEFRFNFNAKLVQEAKTIKIKLECKEFRRGGEAYRQKQ